ncbi:DUF4214 domain-containing protein [Sphingomonas sp. NBWT7]|uniref:DUF4214 domain-containing protein n=1 Tax=Sphingomonas sp. NBWT7 TaxID=2596913 RepID=UPI0016248857|nr:DUF4214 domain-containing protein [Sphingomonas sp. NBWT7]QNE32137.1 DUF4214 domain-containing protein [Sphingomonas sp. NBWT7]
MLKSVKAGGAGGVMKALQYGNSDTEAFIDICYHAILGRAPDQVGLRNYGTMIAAAPNRETLIAVVRSIVMSEEAGKYRDHHLSINR